MSVNENRDDGFGKSKPKHEQFSPQVASSDATTKSHVIGPGGGESALASGGVDARKKVALENSGGAEWRTRRKFKEQHPSVRSLRIITILCEILLLIGFGVLFATRPLAIIGAFLVLVAIELLFVGRLLDYLVKLTLRRLD